MSVLVIGGGINGIAAFRDIALQGVDVALVERGDFASGATSASSRMIHGGIRYLENGEFRLVHESVRERNALLRTAPHFVRPLATTIPIYSTFSGLLQAPLRFLTHRQQGRPSERGALLIKLGLLIYDTFSRDGGAVPRHRFRGRRRSRAELPQLDPAVRYTATYYDASVSDPERLALDLLRDGLDANPEAVAVNYVEAVAREGDSVTLRDNESGKVFAVTAQVIVNAAGPWTDLTNAALGTPTRWMGGTKGSHIVLDHPELLAATAGREIFFEHVDGRIVLIHPTRGRVLVGTTDIPADPADPVVCTEEEVDYFFDLVARVFPRIELSRSQIVYRYSGIRPLPGAADVEPGFISRDYRIEVEERDGFAPQFSLVGGKLTTFRAAGERIADAVLARLDRPRVVSTVDLAIGGGAGFPGPREIDAWSAEHLAGVDPARRGVLIARYGARARDVAAYLARGRDRVMAGGLLSEREVTRMVHEEHVVRLSDVVMRRSELAFIGGLDVALLDEIAAVLARLNGWSEERTRAERAMCMEELELRHGVHLR